MQHEYYLYLQKEYQRDDLVNDSFVRIIITITSILASNIKYAVSITFVVISITFRHYSKTEWLNYPIPQELQ